MIEIVNQPNPFACTSACLAMLTGFDINKIVNEFHSDWMDRKTNPAEFLKKNGFEFIPNQDPFNNCVEWDKVYLLTVPSLNIQGSLHHIVIDMRGDNEAVLDPNNGIANKKYYVGWSKNSCVTDLAVELRSWVLDGEIKL